MQFTTYSSHVFCNAHWLTVVFAWYVFHSIPCKTAHYIIFASDTDFVLGSVLITKGKIKCYNEGAIQSLQICLTPWQGREILEGTLTLNSEEPHSEKVLNRRTWPDLITVLPGLLFYFHFKFLIIQQKYVSCFTWNPNNQMGKPNVFIPLILWGIENDDF